MVLNELEQIKQRVQHTSAGPWRVSQGYTLGGEIELRVSHYATNRLIAGSLATWKNKRQQQADLEFIACSRTDIPNLLSYIEYLQTRCQKLESQLKGRPAANPT